MTVSRRARLFPAFLLSAAFCILSSVCAHAEEEGVIQPFVVEEAAAEGEAEVSVPEIQPQPATPPQGCVEQGLAQVGGDVLPAFYTASIASVTRDAAGIHAVIDGGAISLDGTIYRLTRIELPRDGGFALSGMRYQHHARMVHEAANGTIVVAIIPLREGAANRAVEEMLSAGDAPRMVETGAFLAPQAGWARLDGCAADVPETRLILPPAQISADQAARLAAAL